MSASKGWFHYARVDLLAAKTLLESNEEVLESVGFHLQQCLEKAIKGYLHKKKVRFPKTHDIGQLLTLFSDEDKELVHALEPGKILTLYGVYVRYPDSVEVDLSREKIAELLNFVEETHELILKAVRD